MYGLLLKAKIDVLEYIPLKNGSHSLVSLATYKNYYSAANFMDIEL